MNGIIFDLDGVIALTEEVHRQAFGFAFSRYKIDISEYDWNRDFAGKGHRYIIESVFGKSPGNDRLIDQWVHHYQLIAHKAKPTPGVIDFINSQASPMIIATGSAKRSAEIVLKSLGIRLPLVSMEDAPNPKPDPGLFLLAAERIKTKECIVFEDSIAGIKAGQSAGMKVIALTTLHDSEVLKQYNPDDIIKDFTEVDKINLHLA